MDEPVVSSEMSDRRICGELAQHSYVIKGGTGPITRLPDPARDRHWLLCPPIPALDAGTYRPKYVSRATTSRPTHRRCRVLVHLVVKGDH